MLPDRLATPSAPDSPVDRAAALVDGMASALSANTARALRADLSVYACWCAQRGEAAFPAQTGSVTAFVDDMAPNRAPATVRRYVASIALAERAAGRPSPARDPGVRLALKRMHRHRGRRQSQVPGLTWPLRQRLLAAAGDRLIDARNRALVATAYDAMLRRSELAALRVDDLVIQDGGWATLLVRTAKNDAEKNGHRVYIARDTVAMLRDWLARAYVFDGPLFRSVGKGGRVGRRLPPGQVPRILKAMAARAGVPDEIARTLSGHSPRIGAAQDMIAAGIELPAILQAGRWKSTAMVNRYGEHLLAGQGGAARLARLQHRA